MNLSCKAPGALASPVLGTMNFGGRTSDRDAAAIIERAIERGVTLFDTANVYGDGRSEELLGQVLKGRPEPAIATKVGLFRGPNGPEGLSKAAIEKAVDASRKRLGRDRIDLYYLHAPDPKTPLAETLETLLDLRERGVIGAYGVSNFASWEILALAHLGGTPTRGPAVSQVLYNLLIRQLEIEYFAFTRRFPIHTTVYNPLAGGVLSGRFAPGASLPKEGRFCEKPNVPITLLVRRDARARCFHGRGREEV